MKSFVVIGLGRFGSAVAVELARLGHEVLAIDESEERVRAVKDLVTTAMIADSKDEAVIRSIDVRVFECAIVAIGGDLQDSVLTTLMLKELGVKRIVAKAQSRLHKKILEQIGADEVVFPERDMGERLAQRLDSTSLIELIELSDEYSITEVHSPKEWAGKKISEIDIRKKFGVTIIAVKRPGVKNIIISPPALFELTKEDLLIVVGRNDEIERMSVL